VPVCGCDKPFGVLADHALRPAAGHARFRLEVAQRRSQGNVYRAQVTLVGDHGILLRAEEYAPDFNSAIDTVHDNLQRQIQRYKDKHWRRGKLRRQAGEPEGGHVIDAIRKVFHLK
jgi:ribosomal subunit interface protein